MRTSREAMERQKRAREQGIRGEVDGEIGIGDDTAEGGDKVQHQGHEEKLIVRTLTGFLLEEPGNHVEAENQRCGSNPRAEN